MKLLPTLHGLMFALDITLEVGQEGSSPSSLAIMRQELDILLKVPTQSPG